MELFKKVKGLVSEFRESSVGIFFRWACVWGRVFVGRAFLGLSGI